MLSNASQPAWAYRCWRAMGSTAELVVYADEAAELATAAVERVEALESCWSRFRADSELSALNRVAGTWCAVSPTLWRALDAAREAWTATGGRFDPTVLPRLCELGYDRTFPEVPSDGPPVPEPRRGAIARFGDVELDDALGRLRLPAGVALDLGGIGKGLAADVVADELAAHAVSVSLSIGGDVAVRGPGPGNDGAWPVPVLDGSGATLGEFPLVNEAIVQSTTTFRRWRRGSRSLHHLIDPATGWPSDSGVVAAVVTGPRAALAEAVAKAAIVAGPDDGLALVAAAGLDGWLYLADGTRIATAAVGDDLLATDAG